MSIRKIGKLLGLKKLSSLVNIELTTTVNGKKFKVPIIRNMGLLNLSIKEDWFSELLLFLKLPKDSSFMDIGVNVGQTMLIFRSCYDNPYWGFEPNPSCVSYLSALIKANDFRRTNVIPVGLAGDNYLAEFYIKNEVDSAGTIVKDLRPDYYDAGDVNYVPLFSFDKLNFKAIDKISLIKIDVEGAELEVVSGLTETLKKQRPFLICEILDYHSDKSQQPMQARADKLVGLMRDAGYNVYRIMHEGRKISFEQIDEVKLKLWQPESWNRNDYIFVPKEISGFGK